MDIVFQMISAKPVAGLILLSLVTILVLVVVFMYLVAFYQGREISLWPPKLGTKHIQSDNSAMDIPNMEVAEKDTNRVEASNLTSKHPQSFKTRDDLIIVIEKPKQVEQSPFTLDELVARVDFIYDEHAALFPEETQGYFARVDMDGETVGVVSLSRYPNIQNNEFRLHFLYRMPKEESDRAWERLYNDHIAILNSDWRISTVVRKREAAYKHFMRQVISHFDQIGKFAKAYAPEEKYRIERAEEDYLRKLELRLGPENDTPVIVEGFVQSLHIILDEVQPHTLTL